MAAGAEANASRIEALQKELSTKKTFPSACRSLAELCERIPELSADEQTLATKAMADASKRAFTVLQARFSTPKFWQAGLELFLALEFHLPAVESAEQWREAAMLEVDEDARAAAQATKQQHKLTEQKKHNQGMWSDANTRVTQAEMAAAAGMILVDGDDSRPGMSRDARAELRVITVASEDVCVICQETLPVGSKAKSMPCGHLFHDDCLLSWVEKSNSCPTCRFDELPSEKKHFDEVERRLVREGPNTGLYM